MDLARELAVTINPSGAVSGGRTAAAAFSGVGQAAKTTEGATQKASKALKETGQDMKKTASAGEMLREVLNKQTTILTRIDSSIRRLTTALKEQKSMMDAAKSANLGMAAATDTAEAAVRKHRRSTADATASLSAFALAAKPAASSLWLVAAGAGAAAVANAGLAGASGMTAAAFAAVSVTAVAASASYWKYTTATTAAASATLALMSAQSGAGVSGGGMRNVTGSAVPLLGDSADWRRAHAGFRSYQSQNQSSGPTISPLGGAQLLLTNGHVSIAQRLDAAFLKMNGSLRQAAGGIASFVGQIPLMNAALVAGGLSIAAKNLINTEIALQKASNAMRYGSGTAQEFATNQKFVRQVVDGLGMDLLSTSLAFAKLTASAKGTSMEGAGIRNLFLATAEGATAMGLTADEVGGTLNAFAQMLSKGTVQAEELRGQLGDRLYGAFNMASKAMGMTTQEMNKQLALGKILASDLLPSLTQEMHKAYGPDAAKNVNSLQAGVNRLSTAWTDFKKAVMDGDIGKMIVGGLSESRDLLAEMAKLVKFLGTPMEELLPMRRSPGLLETKEDYKKYVARYTHTSATNAAPALSLSLESTQQDAAKLAKITAENQARYGINVTGRDWNRDAMLENVGAGMSGSFNQMLAMPSFAFDKNAIDSAANGLGALKAEAETLDKVNAGLALFFGDMDKRSAESGKLSEAISKQREELQKQGDTITESVMTPMEKYGALVAELDKLQTAGAITAETYNRKVAAAKNGLSGEVSSGSFFGDFMQGATGGNGRDGKGRRNGVESFTDMFKQAKEAGADTTRALAGGFSSFFDNLIDGTVSAGEAFKKMTTSILSDIAKIMMQRMIAEPLAGAFMGALGGLFGQTTFTGSGGAPVGGDFAAGTSTSIGMSFRHSGGIIGSSIAPLKLVNPSVFNNAPRLHSGLRPDEFPAILQRGEEVIPKGGRGGGVSMSMPITVNVDGGKGGTPEQNQKMGAEIARQIQGMVDERIARAVMPRGILSAVRA